MPARVDPSQALRGEPDEPGLALPEEGDSLAVGVRNYATLFARRKTTILVALPVPCPDGGDHRADAAHLRGDRDAPDRRRAQGGNGFVHRPGDAAAGGHGIAQPRYPRATADGMAVAADTADYLRRAAGPRSPGRLFTIASARKPCATRS